MNTIKKFALTLLCATAFSAPTFAHDGGGRAGGEYGKAGFGMRGDHGKFAKDPAARLAEAKTALNLTAAQLPAWNAFEETSLRLAAQAKAIFETARANNTERAVVRDQMRAFRDAHKAEMKTVRKALGDALTAEQKQTARSLFFGARGHGHRQG